MQNDTPQLHHSQAKNERNLNFAFNDFYRHRCDKYKDGTIRCTFSVE